MRIVATEELGELDSGVVSPAFFQWRWYYQAPSLGLWVLTLVTLVWLRGNRNWQAIPLLLTIVLWMLEGLSLLFGFLVVAWIIVWLAGRWLPGRQPVADGLPTT